MSDSTQVLIHLTANQYGGVETHVYHLALALVANGGQVTLTSQRKFDLNLAWTRDLLQAGVKIVVPPEPVAHTPSWMSLARSRYTLARHLPAKAFDRVIGQGHGGAYSWMKRFVRPEGLFIWHEYWYGVPTHGDEYTDYKVPAPQPFSWKMQQMVQRLDAIVTGCEKAKRNLEQVQRIALPIHIIPPLTHVDGLLPTQERLYDTKTKLKLVMVARIGFGKGVGALLDVWEMLDIGDAELHLYGPLESDFGAQIAKRYESNTGVYFHGAFERARLPEILADADLGLMLSIEEGYGLATWEYMACGLPFVMTDCGAATEFTRDNPDSVMVPVSHDGIRRGIEEMVRRIRSGKVSRIRLQEHHSRFFSYEQSAAEHVRMILGPNDLWAAPLQRG